MRTFSVIIIMMAGLCLKLSAGNIASLFEELKLDKHVLNDTILFMDKISTKKPIVVECDTETPRHIGISLFSDEMKQMVSRDVCNFIERLMLEISLFPSAKDAAKYLRHHKIKMTHNGVEYSARGFDDISKIIDDISSPSLFNVKHGNGLFQVQFEYGIFNEIFIEFPASRELVVGMDKKESDIAVNKMLMSPTFEPKLFSRIDSSLCEEYNSNILKYPGNIYITEKLHNDKYFDKDTFEPIYTEKFLYESVTNLMQGLVKTDLKLEIKHRMYGNYTPDFIVLLNSVFEAFNDDFELYTGNQVLDDGRLQCMALFRNITYNYCHMLIVTADPKLFFKKGEILSADFFSNIPQHNIKKLF